MLPKVATRMSALTCCELMPVVDRSCSAADVDQKVTTAGFAQINCAAAHSADQQLLWQ
jgi:hypothetical protein